jgi:O-antigen ligase
VKRTFALLAIVLVLALWIVPVAFAAEVGDSFDPEALVINGVALVPLISVIISIIKGWTKVDSKYIPLINVILGSVAVLVVGVVNQNMTILSALIMTLGVVLGSQAFHETFGHAANIIKDLFGGGKPPQGE